MDFNEIFKQQFDSNAPASKEFTEKINQSDLLNEGATIAAQQRELSSMKSELENYKAQVVEFKRSMTAMAEMNSSMVMEENDIIEEKENNEVTETNVNENKTTEENIQHTEKIDNITPQKNTSQKNTAKQNVAGASSGKKQPKIINSSSETDLIAQLEAGFDFYPRTQSINDDIVKQETELLHWLKKLKAYMSIFKTPNELLKYLICYQEKRYLSQSEFFVLWFIYSWPHPWMYISDNNDAFNMFDYMFSKEHGYIFTEIYEDLKARYKREKIIDS